MYTKISKFLFGQFEASISPVDGELRLDNGLSHDERQTVSLSHDEQVALYLILRDNDEFESVRQAAARARM